jgi:hypothetical protein
MRLCSTILAATAAALALLPAAAPAVTVPDGGDATFFESPFALAAGDVDHAPDLYVRTGGQTHLISNGDAAGKTYFAGASADGSVAFFYTEDNRLHVRSPAGLALVTPHMATLEHAGADGTRGYIESAAALTADDTDLLVDVYEYTVADGSLRLVTEDTPNWDASFTWASPNGSVFFGTREQVEASDVDDEIDVYATGGGGTVFKLSPGNGDHPAFMHALSTKTGRMVFSTSEKLVPADIDANSDLYSTDGGAPVLLTPSPNLSNMAKAAYLVGIRKADAGRIVFETAEPLLPADQDTTDDLYSWEAGQLTLMSPGPGSFIVQDISDDAETVLLLTDGQRLASDTDQTADMYLARDGGLAHLLKTNQPFDQSLGYLRADGTAAAFSTAEAVTNADTDQKADVYVVEGGNPALASGPATGSAADPGIEALPAGFEASGELVLFSTERLTSQDRNEERDVYGFQSGKLSMLSADGFAPETKLTPGVVSETEFSSTLESTEQGSFECRADGASWFPCDATWAVGPLAPGAHVLEARAVDVSGNADASPARSEVTVPGGTPPAPAATTPEPVGGAPATPAPAAPVVSGAKLRRRRTLTFSISQAATVQVTIQRRAGRGWKRVRTMRIAAVAGANRAKLAKLPRRGKLRVRVVPIGR